MAANAFASLHCTLVPTSFQPCSCLSPPPSLALPVSFRLSSPPFLPLVILTVPASPCHTIALCCLGLSYLIRNRHLLLCRHFAFRHSWQRHTTERRRLPGPCDWMRSNDSAGMCRAPQSIAGEILCRSNTGPKVPSKRALRCSETTLRSPPTTQPPPPPPPQLQSQHQQKHQHQRKHKHKHHLLPGLQPKPPPSSPPPAPEPLQILIAWSTCSNLVALPFPSCLDATQRHILTLEPQIVTPAHDDASGKVRDGSSRLHEWEEGGRIWTVGSLHRVTSEVIRAAPGREAIDDEVSIPSQSPFSLALLPQPSLPHSPPYSHCRFPPLLCNPRVVSASKLKSSRKLGAAIVTRRCCPCRWTDQFMPVDRGRADT